MFSEAITPLALAVLVPLVLAGFAAQANVGFGAALIVTTLASALLPTSVLMPAVVTLDLVFCVVMTVRLRREVDVAFLARRLVPAFAMGLPIGIALIVWGDESLLRRAVGLGLVGAAVLELWRARVAPRPFEGGRPVAALLVAGIAHFATGAGGLIAVYVAARVLLADGRYRATLFATWMVLDVLLFLGYVQSRRFSGDSLVLAAILLPSCAIGLVLGEIAFRRISPERRRVLVHSALVLAGAALLVGG